MYSCIHVFFSTSTSPALDPSGLAALQFPRSTRRDFAQPFDPPGLLLTNQI
jgi:hypothetical protein